MTRYLNTVVKNGRIVTPGGIFTGSVGIKGGHIVALHSREVPIEAEEIIDAEGLYVIPGIVDPEAHLGTHEDFAQQVLTESKAAAASGVTTWGFITTVTRMGVPVDPVEKAQDLPSYRKTFSVAKEICDSSSFTDYFFTFIIMNEQHAQEIPDYSKEFGVTSFKYYLHLNHPEIYADWHAQKNLRFMGLNDGVVYLGMEQAARVGPPAIICLHCENWEIARLFRERLEKEGRNDIAAWSEGSPAFCEAAHVRQYAYFAKMTDCPIYIQHVTTPETVDEIRQAKREGVRVTAQTGPHYLTLTKGMWKLNVPLRDQETCDFLWRALRDGEIDCLGSDHVNTGRKREEMIKDGTVWSMVSGFSSRVESALPVMLSEGVNKGRITLNRLVEMFSERTAKAMGLFPRKGTISIGSDADLVLVDLNKKVTVTSDVIHTSTGWSIYEGWDLKGWPVLTMLRGKVIMRWKEGDPGPSIMGSPSGQYLRRIIR